MSQKNNFKKCHSGNLDQTDLILDFLSTLDKSKNSYTWQDELNQINKDWCRMMEDSDESDGAQSQDENQQQQYTQQQQQHYSQQQHYQYPQQTPMSPSKKVTWSEKLTNVKTISPKQCQSTMMVAPDPRSSDIQHPHSRLLPDTDNVRQQQQSDVRQYHHQKQYHHHHHHRDLFPYEAGRAGPKMRLISIVPNSL